MKMKLTSIPLVTLLVLAGCSNSGTAPQSEQTGGHGGAGTGGETHAGGSGGSGGTSSQGGTTSTGGTTSKGGSSGSGGTSAAGGSGSGGTSSTGGKTGTGGVANGGTTSTGGESHAGGTGAGGSSAKDGGPSSGGVLGSGGVPGSGGVGAMGGSTAKDGGVDAKTGTGGITGTGGGSTVASACGLPDGPNTGVAAPTGAGTKIDVLPWAGFKAAVTFSLDDGNSSQISNYSTLNGMGVPLTFYLITQNATDPIWKQALKDGHEIGNHTQTHACGTTAAGESDIKSKFGVTAYTMAAPNGDAACSDQAIQNNIFINRGVSDAVISFTADDSSLAYNLNTNIPNEGSAASGLTGPIDKAYSSGGWQTFCIHGFTGDANAYHPFALSSLTDAVKTEKAKKDLWIDTMVAVGAYWRGARAFAKASPTTSGTDKVWTWTLPKGFPPNKCLRVKPDGGTLKQGSTTLAWDDHGYYEISLDAGSVTLSP